ncbi:MAG TPA: cytochrome d ubiquinol oxidase subunit II [Holophagaceae bacterium]|nr:cytochrome d ubiquinol oxidase subunit II [Holophagaceae bacterium]
MAELWFWLVSVMVAIYVVMDGFDFGAGALSPFVARTDTERRAVLAAIGPFWDGNEVWLLAAGGSLFLAFPRVLAAGFSGFYLAMWMVVWCLILRGISIEFRSHVQDTLWRAFWDFVLAAASILLPVLLGAALGNVIRGVPIGPDGTFELPLFTSFGVLAPVGILDWYTVLVGVFALVALLAHGALFLAWKTTGELHARSVRAARTLWPVTAVIWIAATFATRAVQPLLFQNLPHRPLAWLALALVAAGAALVVLGLRGGRYLQGFLGSAFIWIGLLAATAASVWPVMLGSLVDPAYSLTALNSATDPHGLATGLRWWCLGFPIALGYGAFLFRLHRGKAEAAGEGEGY